MKLIDLLNLNKEAALPDRDRVLKRATKRNTSLKVVSITAASLCAAAALVLVGAWLLNGVSVAGKPEIIATGAINVIEAIEAKDGDMVALKKDSSLTIRTTESVPVKELKNRISIEPEAEFSLKQTDDCSYELSFKEELAANTLYNVNAVYGGKVVYRWAFQTETVFNVTEVYPANESYVALDALIEVTFSHSDVEGFQEAFKISPAVKGTFEHYGRTWAFVPNEPLEPTTLYTVTIAKEIAGPNGMNLEEDYAFSFTTTNEGAYGYLIYQESEAADTFLVNENPIAAISYEGLDASAASVKVYRFEDSGSYIDAYKKYVRNGEVSGDIAALAKDAFQTFNATPILTENYCGIYPHAAFINYPEPLPQGYYFAELQMGGRKFYQLLQSTTLSVYTLTTNGDYMVWVNSTETGKAVEGATITLEGFKDKETNKAGTAYFSAASEEMDLRVMTVENGEYPYVVVLNGEATDREIKLQNQYYTYISTNSTVYRSDDTVGVFGVILPRKNSAKSPKNVVLRSSTGEEYTAEVGKNGLFTLDVPLNNTADTVGFVELYLNDVWLDGTYFTIADYELPVYQISVSTDKTVYAAGESVRVTAQVTYSDGTPAADVYIESDYPEISGYTDANGSISATIPAEGSDGSYISDTTSPEMYSIYFSMGDEVDSYYCAGTEYVVFDKNLFMTGRYADGMVTVNADQIDLEKANQIEKDRIYIDAYDPACVTDQPASLRLTGELHELTYVKEITGSSYDPINKKTVHAYEYREEDTLLRTVDAVVENGVAEIAIPEESTAEKSYYLLLRAEGEESDHLKIYLDDSYYTSDSELSYYFTADKMGADIGDAVCLSVLDTVHHEAITSGSVLYSVVSGEILETYHSIFSQYTMTFKKEHAPDIQIFGAYFDGNHIYSLGSEYLYYENENSRLQIEMTKDELQYKPGDEVTLNFKVTDDAGEPVSAALNISVIDRALYLSDSAFEDPCDMLYGSKCFSSEIYTTCSYRDFKTGEPGYGEGGGGGGDPRSDFEDTPYFKTIQTNAKGEGAITFTLPDSITEWKVVARAITDEVQAGMETFSLVSTQDFFVHTSMGEEIKTADDFTIALKADGIKATAEDECTFRVGLTDQNGNEINTLTASALKAQYTYLNFGKLDAGYYTVYIQAECGERKDSIIRNLTVEDSQNAVWVHHTQTVPEQGVSLELESQKGNVILTIADEERAFWQEAMARLNSNPGDRVDQVLGSYLAEQYYATGIWNDPETTDYGVIRSYMEYDSVRLFPNSEGGDLKTSAKLAAVAPEFCNKENLIWSFEEYLNNRYAARVDVITAYFGMAALGEPVLADLQQIYETQTDLTMEEAAYLALGFAYGGDYTTAQYLFDLYLKDALTEENGRSYVATELGPDEDLTGCCSLLSNRLSLASSEGLIRYIVETDTELTLLNLELISYLNDHVVQSVGTNTVTVSTGDGRNETYTYPKMNVLTLTLTPEQAKQIRVMNKEGVSVVGYSYYGKTADLAKLDGGIAIKEVSAPESMVKGEWATITVKLDIPEDFEQPSVELVLPNGLIYDYCYVSSAYTEYSVSPEYNRRKLSIALPQDECVIDLSVCAAMPGSYVLEPIAVVHSGDHRFLYTDPINITITE